MKTGLERAKELFMQYGGNRFYMDHDGVGQEYDACRVPRETEEAWRKEYLSGFFEEKKHGREALRAYSLAVEFLKGGAEDGCWERALYYPLRSDWLDDVTVLFLLPVSFRLAEKRAEKGRFSREAADEYLRVLDSFVRDVRKRAEDGALTRAADYRMREFADDAYVAAYLEDLLRKWAGLSRKL